jgi:hypothetical protein
MHAEIRDAARVLADAARRASRPAAPRPERAPEPMPAEPEPAPEKPKRREAFARFMFGSDDA